MRKRRKSPRIGWYARSFAVIAPEAGDGAGRVDDPRASRIETTISATTSQPSNMHAPCLPRPGQVRLCRECCAVTPANYEEFQ